MKNKQEFEQYIVDNVNHINRFDDFIHRYQGYNQMPYHETFALGFNLNKNMETDTASDFTIDNKLIFRQYTYRESARTRIGYNNSIYTTKLGYWEYPRHLITDPPYSPPQGSQAAHSMSVTSFRVITNDEKHFWLDDHYSNQDRQIDTFFQRVLDDSFEYYIFPKSYLELLCNIKDEDILTVIVSTLADCFNLNAQSNILAFMLNAADGYDINIEEFQQKNLQCFTLLLSQVINDKVYKRTPPNVLEYLYTNKIINLDYLPEGMKRIVEVTLNGNHKL